MIVRRPTLVAAAATLTLATSGPAWAQANTDQPIPLLVEAGRPLRVALDTRTRVKYVGQEVTATLVEPVFAHDRIVIPAGTKAIGHIERLQTEPAAARLRSFLGGDFSPPRVILVQFDRLLPIAAPPIPIRTSAGQGAENVVLQVADTSDEDGLAARARQEIAREAKHAIAAVKAPGKLERLKDALIGSLPYHPQFLAKGTVYMARLESTLDFGSATPIERAPPGTPVAPGSLLNARLITAVDSATAARGMRIEAVLTQPVLAADRRLILPEGTTVAGEVTFTKPAGRFHRHGQLRLLFESVRAPGGDSEALVASLHSVESTMDDHLVLDDEGGATSGSSKARFVAPALAALAVAGSLHGRLDYDTDGAGPEMQYGGVGSSTAGGFLGLGLLGVGLSQISRPMTLALGAVGLGRTTYSAVFGRGRNISFPVDASIQIQLAPGARGRQP